MKSSRQKIIAKIIEENEINTQEELVERLRQAGVEATQATISRDIRRMNLRKIPGKSGKPCYAMAPSMERSMEGAYARAMKEGLVSVDTAMNMLVLKTHPGMAMPVAAAVDSMQMDEVVGTIAGDDTVMSAIRSVADAERLKKWFQKMIE